MADWDARFMTLARHVSGWSKDPSTRVGAVLVGQDRREVAIGYNGFPPGIADYSYRLEDRTTKYRLTQHAERNVLDNARFDVRGGTLYCTLAPCAECAKSIVSKGIRRVVIPETSFEHVERWGEEMRWARQLFHEADIELAIIEE